METEFTPIMSLLGGVLIGLSAVLMMASAGRITGISGILGGLFTFAPFTNMWRLAFVVGVVLSPFIFRKATGITPDYHVSSDVVILVIGGLLVGLGTVMGSGCTSGHGVCGMARLSKRSFFATAVFMVSAVVTVFLVRHVL
ncbi:MAG: YeeE/YedE family protein [Rhizobiales bacterium]|nr:YeeE/YedE family protein [Hyphomicrobiales bacterium]